MLVREEKYLCLSACVCRHVWMCVCANYLPQTSLRLCVDHTWPYGMALWRHTVVQMDTFCAGHILNDPPAAMWTTALINQGSLLSRGNCTGSTHWKEESQLSAELVFLGGWGFFCLFFFLILKKDFSIDQPDLKVTQGVTEVLILYLPSLK